MEARRRLKAVRRVSRDLVANVRRVGVRAAVDATLRDLYCRELDLVLVKDLDGEHPGDGDGAPPRGALQIERIGPEHARELSRLWTEEHPLRTGEPGVLDNVDRGYDGFLIRRDGEAIGYFWWVAGPAAAAHPDARIFRIDLRDGDVYGFSNLIARDRRGGGVAIDALKAVEAELAQLGYRRLWGFVDFANTPARWLYAVSGWQLSHTVRRIRVLGIHRGVVVARA